MADLGIGETRLRGDEQIAAVRRLSGKVSAGDDRAGSGRRQGGPVAGVVEHADFIWASGLERGNVVDHDPPGLIVDRRRTDPLGDLGERKRAIAAEKSRIRHLAWPLFLIGGTIAPQ